MLGKTEGRRRRGRQKTRWLLTDSVDVSLSKLWETGKDTGVLQSMGSQSVGHNQRLNNKAAYVSSVTEVPGFEFFKTI